MRENIEKSIKRWLKRKVTITLGMMVAFMITGGVVYSNDGVINESVYITVDEQGNIKVTPEGAGVLEGNTWTNNGKINVTWGNGVIIDSSVTEDKNFSLINNGVITRSNSPDDYSGNGIYNNGTIETLTNSGLIKGNSNNSGFGSGNGIYNESGTIESLTNNGIITGTTKLGMNNGNGNGIFNWKGTIESLINNGIITGTTKLGINNRNGNGIYNYLGTITTLTNSGLIKGNSNNSEFGSGIGIYNESGTIGSLTNNGTITGNSYSGTSNGNGIYNERYGTIGSLTNYGIIAGSNKAINNQGTITTQNNYGLLIDGAGTDNVTVNAGAGGEITEGGEYKGYIVKNTFGDTNNQYKDLTSITENDITLSSNSEKLIINGYNKGLKVGKDLTLSNSIVNSYTTAINIEGGNFTGDNIVINGGADKNMIHRER